MQRSSTENMSYGSRKPSTTVRTASSTVSLENKGIVVSEADEARLRIWQTMVTCKQGKQNMFLFSLILIKRTNTNMLLQQSPL